jgi:host cell surface-exposed lipoprotein
MKKIALIIGGLFALLASCGIGAAMGGSGDATTNVASSEPAATETVTATPDTRPQATATATVTRTVTETKKVPGPTVRVTVTAAKPKPKPRPEPAAVAGDPTAAQENAIGSAQDYLENQAFSRKGLIEQLMFEDYSRADATYAVDHLTVNYRKQAAKSAKDYLNEQHFSHGGLVQQLMFEGYTRAQAEYGTRHAGL